MALRDYLSKKDKKSLLLPKGILVGTVIRAFVKFTRPPKEKRFVVVGFRDDEVHLAAVLINSEINTTINYNEELQSHHILLQSEGREYLTHDSFIDCTEIFPIKINEIQEKIDENPEEVIKGTVDKSDLKKIFKTLVNSDLIKGKYKKKYGIFDFPLDD